MSTSHRWASSTARIGRLSRRSRGPALVAALLVAAAGLSISRVAEPDGSPLAPGVVLLAAAAVAAAILHRPWSALAAVSAVALVLAMRLGDGLHTGFAGGRGAAVAVGSWLLIAGSAVALGASAPSITKARRRHVADGVSAPGGPSATEVRGRVPRGRRGHPGLALGLMLLSAICAEDLAAYDDTTGRPAELLVGAVVFGCLYGGPALLIREFVRRTGRGWPAILLLATAAGLVQAGLIDQSMFNDNYRDIEIWDELYEPTRVGALGLSVYATQSFVVGHLVYSFSAPIALVEAIRPTAARDAWVGWKAMSVVAVLYLAVAGLILGDTLANEPTHPSVPQVVGTLVFVSALVAAALRTRSTTAPGTTHRSAPRPRLVFAASFVLATPLAVAPSTWLGVAASAAVLLLGGFLLVRASQGVGWGLPHVVAVAAGAVLSRGLLAFSYYPVIGDVSATRKYAHNVVMLLIVGVAIALAFRRSRADELETGLGIRELPRTSARRQDAGAAAADDGGGGPRQSNADG